MGYKEDYLSKITDNKRFYKCYDNVQNTKANLNEKEKNMNEEYKVINYNIPQLDILSINALIAPETIILCKETYNIGYENKGHFSERQFESLKREVAIQLSTKFLERMSFSCTDEGYRGFISYKFSNEVLIEKERLELHQKIDKLKFDLGDLRERSQLKDKVINDLEDYKEVLVKEINQYKNANLWQRIKFLFKGN